MSAQTPRRNPARAASAASRASRATPVPAPAPASAASVSGNRRPAGQAAGQLPPVPTSQSHAYGAHGKAVLAQAMRIHASTSLTQAFDKQREEAAERDNIVTAAAIARRAAAAAQTPQTGPSARVDPGDVPSTIPEESSESEVNLPPSPSNRPGAGHVSLHDISKSFGPVHETGLGPRPRVDMDAFHKENVLHDVNHWLQQTDEQEMAGDRDYEDNPPSWLQILLRFAERNIFTQMLVFVGVPLLLGVLLWNYINWGAPPEERRFTLDDSPIIKWGESIKSYPGKIWGKVPQLHEPSMTPNGTYTIKDKGMQKRVDRLEDSVHDLWARTEMHASSLQKLEEELPEQLVILKDKDTGELKIPEYFWQALRDRMDRQSSIGKSTGESESWDSFLKRNRAGIEAIISKEVTFNVDSRIDQIADSLHVVTKEAFISTLQENYESLAKEIKSVKQSLDSKYRFDRNDVAQVATGVAQRVMMKQMEQLPTAQLDAVAQANLIKNSELALRTVNFFSARLGAVIDPHLTSPTQTKTLKFLQKLYTRLVWIPGPHPPIAALESWEEATDCWCAAQSGGKAQLAVIMPHLIYPTKVTVEHVPKQGTLDISSAPKWLELWVEIKDAEQREAVGRARDVLIDGVHDAQCEESVGPDYVCIGRFMYNIHALNHVQTFPLDVDMQSLGVHVNKAVVRVTQSWGREWTCIYRIRMHGELAFPLFGNGDMEEVM